MADLARRLRRTRWTSLAPGDAWELGVSRPYLERLVAYWSNGYSWRRQEAELNQLPQFTADLDGARLHFVHRPVDRFHAWCDDLDATITPDELLTNIMIYWVTSTIGPSMDSYRADAASPSLSPADRVEVPVGLALFPGDIGGIPPRSFAERTLNVQRWTEMPRGGHFAALEQPELYAGDLEAFFATPQVARAGAREGDRDAPRAV